VDAQCYDDDDIRKLKGEWILQTVKAIKDAKTTGLIWQNYTIS
jgi:hypothetical protein